MRQQGSQQRFIYMKICFKPSHAPNVLMPWKMFESTFPDMENNNLWHSSPVGIRPLSCAQGQCWCWSPEIHRGRFHQPERKWTASVTDLRDERDNAFDEGDWERLEILSLQNTYRPITQSRTWLSLRQSININILQSRSVGGKIQCFCSSQKPKVSVSSIFNWPLQGNNRGP